MAAGDITLFEEFSAEISNEHDLDADDFRIALITDTPPAASTATPRLADFTQCTGGGNYTQVTTVGTGKAFNATFTEAAGTATFDGDNVSWTQHASNPSNARCALICNTTNNNIAVGYIDLGATIDMTAGDLTININASGVFTLS